MNVLLDNLNKALNFVYRANINIVLCGDFNIDSYKYNTDHENLICMLSEFNPRPEVQWPTRIGRTSISTIDQVFTSFKEKCINCIIDNTISDLQTILIELVDYLTDKSSEPCTVKRPVASVVRNGNAFNYFSQVLKEDHSK
nr:unnamed protein product [Callosobruchus chinensis]